MRWGGDGIFNIADYASDPRLSPIVVGDKCFIGMDPTQKSTTDRMLGDLNHNCILDPGDLILMFSDGVDDDHNGYVDDIAGWDFFKNDNDPYDDTRFGHGTNQALGSTAQGNNGIGSIGTCPGCMVMPLRVGNSFVTDANNFAKGVVYAVGSGVSVIQEALGALNNTTFSRAAIDYAYAHGVIVAAGMADENSRHHNMPATWNHTLPVHTIRYNNDSFHDSSTFLAFDSCTNYGGHGALSVSGSSCSSEATGRIAGIAGLVYSAGRSLQPAVALSAEEVMQILKQTADDVNVPESTTVIDPLTGLGEFYESKPGWDQRFNYGRANAFKALGMVQAGKIPPEVDIVSPTWYQPIYASRTNAPVPIIGTIAAKRAMSYDYVVEWAPGVEPNDADFKPLIAEVTNVPSSAISGGPSAPLATFDPRVLDTTHPPDPDSQPFCNFDKTVCWGPNDKTVTLRVRVTAHYAGFDQTGDARRTIAITNDLNGGDPDLLPGFPLDLGSSGEGSSKLADIDGDGVRDIVFGATDGSLHVFSLRSGLPVEVAGFPFHTALALGFNAPGTLDSSIARETIEAAPAIGDIDGNGKPDIVVSTYGTIYAVDVTGKLLPGWPVNLPLVPSCPLDPSKPKPPGDCSDLTHDLARGTYAAPVLVDFDHDGKLEIVQAAFDANIYVFQHDGTPRPGWPVRVHTSRAAKMDRIMSTPTITDLNGDGIPDIVSGSNETIGGGGASGPVFAIDGRGTLTPNPQAEGPFLPNWPWARTSFKLFPVVGSGIVASQFAADFDGDGVEEIGVMGNAAPPPILSQPAVGDLDQDGVPDPIMTGGSLSVVGSLSGGDVPKKVQFLGAAWSGATGKMFDGPPNQVPANHKDPRPTSRETTTPRSSWEQACISFTRSMRAVTSRKGGRSSPTAGRSPRPPSVTSRATARST